MQDPKKKKKAESGEEILEEETEALEKKEVV